MFTERAELYGYDHLVAIELAKRPRRFTHTFGGPIRHHGAHQNECGLPLHRIFQLDTHDPLVPVSLPGVRWLPLYYCFSYANPSCGTGYRVVADEQVETYFNPVPYKKEVGIGFPHENFPGEFIERPVRLRKTRFDPSKLKHVEWYHDVYGTRFLSDDDYQLLVQRCRKRYPFGDRHPQPGPWTGTDAELVRRSLWGPSCQGHPASVCPNPECENHSRRRSMEIFAFIPAHPFGISADAICLWGPSLECGDIPEIIFEICPKCQAIMATSQNT